MIEMIGGPGRDRTDDLFHAMEARSQTAPQAHVEGQLLYCLCCGGIRQFWLGASVPAARDGSGQSTDPGTGHQAVE